ncbi:CMRF35-like molecule 8 [Myripristis murdjan]|uniref:CMRF35-like molecule 8 n=1 Tax=Myripristis murdjan TaxID=586833 RepID=UPI001175DC3F|nr:CMRF35-like molecule 8 [Myripristis murdjan]
MLKLCFMTADCCRTSESKAAYLGGSVTIDCKYPESEESNIRYFCKEDGNLSCKNVIMAHAENNNTRTDRFILSNSRMNGVYRVTISSLTEEDAGKYWCAMKRTEPVSIAKLTEVHLSVVIEKPVKTKTTTTTASLAAATVQTSASAASAPASTSLTSTAKSSQSADCCRTSESKAAYLGGSVTIDCKYPESEESNIRYFCKEDGNLYCKNVIMARAEHNNTRIDRFILSNSRMNGVYRVTISALTEEDAGKYWCAMKRTEPASIAKLTEVHLSVVKKPVKTKTTTTTASLAAATVQTSASAASAPASTSLTSTAKSAQSGTSVYTAVSVSLAVLLIVLTLLIIYKYKMHKKQGSHRPSENTANIGHNREDVHGDHDYEEVEERLHQPAAGSAVHSLYATVSMPTQALDFPHYASVIFQKRPGADSEATVSFSTGSCSTPATDKPDLSTCDYACVTATQSATKPAGEDPQATVV